jgi:CheY-like chemotaxis protein
MSYNIIVVDDDPLVLRDSVIMYEEMIRFDDLSKVFGEDKGTVSEAHNAREAERILGDHLNREPSLVQLLHVDERMPDERGSEFVDRMRRVYTTHNIGALLVTGYAADVSVMNSREKGVYRYISKPVTPQVILPHLEDLVEMIKLKDKPHKRKVSDVFDFRVIETESDLLQLLRLRYLVWNKLGYIPPQFRSDSTQLEVDDYDKNSLHLGGFLMQGEGQNIVTGARIITLNEQERTKELFNKVLSEHGDNVLRRAFGKAIEAPLPIFFNYHPQEFLSKYPAGIRYGEYSRLMNLPTYRGLDLAPRVSQLAHYVAKEMLGLRIGLAECLVKHVPMNINRLGFSGIIPGTDIRNVSRVEQIANAIYVDLDTLDDPSCEFNTDFSHISNRMRYNRSFCYCQIDDCIPCGYLHYQKETCARQLHKL